MIRRILTAFVALAGVGHVPGALAGSIAVEQAPPAWVAYANQATAVITGWLNDQDPRAVHLREALGAMQPDPAQPAPPLVLKLWINRLGELTRIDFVPLPDEQAGHDLRALLSEHGLPPPPRGMRLPMRIEIQLQPVQGPSLQVDGHARSGAIRA